MYINPIEILGLGASVDAMSIDNETIKKAKRKLFADIELSDSGTFNYYGLQLSKGNCEQSIDELTNETTKEFYLFLANNKQLNEFLVNGNIELFNSFKQESIYKLKEFIDFVSPYYTPKFDKALSETFDKGNIKVLSTILNTTVLISLSDLNNAYKGVVKKLDDRIIEVRKITKDINEEQSEYSEKNIIKIVSRIEKEFPYKTINLLPNYFQSQILKIAEEINYLNLAIWDKLDNPQVCEDLLSHVLKLNIDGLNKPTFQKNYEIVRERNQKRIELENNAPLIKKWASVIVELKELIANIDAGNKFNEAKFHELNNLVNIIELNNSPIYLDEIRLQIGYLLRGLSISIWNKLEDIKTSIQVIDLALKIKIDKDINQKFLKDKADLLELEKKYEGIIICYFCGKNKTDEKSKITKEIYLETYRSIFPREVRFSHTEVYIPRCQNCKDIHQKGDNFNAGYLLGGIILGTIIGYAIEDSATLAFTIGGGLIGWLLGKYQRKEVSSNNNIKDNSDNTLRKHPIVKEKIRNGWTFSKPTA